MLILLKTPKMMEANCPNNRQEIKELISDFRDVLESSLYLPQLGGRQQGFIQGHNGI
jgi:hypothetical protein